MVSILYIINTQLYDFIIAQNIIIMVIRPINTKLTKNKYVIFEHISISNKICIISE